MRLAGVTWWRSNYGSILQAYALQETLNSKNNVEYEILCQYGKKVASASNLLEKLHRIGFRKSLKRALWKFGFPGLRKRNQKIQAFMDTHLKVSSRQYNEDTIVAANEVYDGFICGSDQIWNTELVSTSSMYWLGFADEGKLKLSYAPSVGVNSFSVEQAKTIRENLKNFKGISSREESGTNLINKTLGSNACITVLDPTLLFTRTDWDAICTDRRYKEPYIFVYMLRGTKKQRKLIEQYAKSKKLKIVTMPFLDADRVELYDLFFGDYKLWDADPADFISVIKNAECVFTDSFHSMVFSCIYHRTFYTFPKIGKAQLNRVVNFQEMLHIPNRMISDTTSLEDIMSMESINWKQVDDIIAAKREVSFDYLEKALG